MSDNLKVNAQPRASVDVVVSLNDSKASTATAKATKPPSGEILNFYFYRLAQPLIRLLLSNGLAFKTVFILFNCQNANDNKRLGRTDRCELSFWLINLVFIS